MRSYQDIMTEQRVHTLEKLVNELKAQVDAMARLIYPPPPTVIPVPGSGGSGL